MFTTHISDVVVVGGGLAGITAAHTALEQNVSVTIVDKGPFGHSGNTGINWGHSFETAELSTDGGIAGVRYLVFDALGILDQEHAQQVVQAQIEGKPRQALERFGNIFQRDDEGKIVGLLESDGLGASPDGHISGIAQYLRKQKVPIFENTMMLDLLVNEENQITGIVALDLYDGSAHVFRAKRVILATGGYHWVKGVSAGSPEATGDAHAALLKRGIAFKDMEFPQYDFSGIRPFGWRPDPEKDMLEIGISMSVNGEVHHRMCGSNKERLTAGLFTDSTNSGSETFQGTLLAAAKELYAGNGSPGDGSGNGLLFSLDNIMEEPSTVAYPTYKGHVLNVEHNMDFQFPEYYEIIANEYSSSAMPAVNPQTNETEIKGLYAALATLSVRSSMYAWAQGYLAGKDAASKVPLELLPDFSAEDAEGIIAKAHSSLQAHPAQGIRATTVFRNIQRVFYHGFGFLKEECEMLQALTELKRIQSEDVPRMFCADQSRIFNREWRTALEVESALICATGSIEAGLARRESRAPFFRRDYPRMDNDNFLCSLWTKLHEDGSWSVSRDDIVDTIVPKREIRHVIDDENPLYDISIPNTYGREDAV